MFKLFFINLVTLFAMLVIGTTYADVNCQQQYAANANELSVCTTIQQQLTATKNTFKKPFNSLANNSSVLFNTPSQNQTPQQTQEQAPQQQSNTNSVHIPYN